jgi:hypothetical protein
LAVPAALLLTFPFPFTGEPFAGDDIDPFPSTVAFDAEVDDRPSVVASFGRRDSDGMETPPARSLREKGVICGVVVVVVGVVDLRPLCCCCWLRRGVLVCVVLELLR